MISQIDISGFRSIKEVSIPLKKLNILYGQNGCGKSSVMYAPYVFRNFCVNPNQSLDSLFNLRFINLGGFENVVNNLSIGGSIKIRLIVSTEWERGGDMSGELVSFNLILHNHHYDGLIFFR